MSTRNYQHVLISDNARAHFGDNYLGDQHHYDYAEQDNGPKVRKSPLQQLLESLSFPKKNYRFATIEPAYQQTCRWLFVTPKYTRWRDHNLRRAHNRTLWLKGKPGTGKSTIIKCAVEHANAMYPNECNIHFFFNARGEKLEKCTEGMFRSLLHQVAQDVPSLLQSIHADALEGYTSTGWPVDLLRSMFREAILYLASHVQLNCYIDALDEGEDEDQTREMVRFFEELAETAVSNSLGLSIFFASRHYPNITIRRSESIILDNCKGHHADIASYVRDKLLCGPPTLKAELIASILQRSSEVFLWVVLVVRNLNTESDRGNQHRLEEALQATPKALDDFFDNIVHGDDADGFLLPTLLWVLFAHQSLSPLELYLAVIHSKNPELSSSVIWDRAIVDITSIRNFITTSSRGLLQAVSPTDPLDPHERYLQSSLEANQEQDSTVQFIHESVREYLLGSGILRLDPTLTGNIVGLSNLRLARWCRSYVELGIQHVESRVARKVQSFDRYELLDAAPFSRHAMQGILYHSEEATSHGLNVPVPFEDYLNAYLSLVVWFNDSSVLRFSNRVTTLHVLAGEGYTGLMLKLLQRFNQTERQSYVNLKVERAEERHSGALHFAARCMRLDAVRILLRNGADVNACNAIGDTPILCAVQTGISEMTQTMLEYGADVNVRNGWEATPLLQAVSQGHNASPRVIEVLLKHGADVNAVQWSNTSALRTAVVFANVAVIKTLLVHGADVYSRKEGNPSIMEIAQGKSDETITRLLSYFADLPLRERLGAARTLEQQAWWKDHLLHGTVL